MNSSKMHCRWGLTLLVSILSLACTAQIGTWRDHLNYNNALHLDIFESEVYVASDNGMFIFDKGDNSISKLSKVNGLSDIGISAIKINKESGTLLVGYENGNLDVIRDRTITNFTAIKNSSVIGDKTIRHIHYFGSQAYISTGVGIISFNLDRLEVSDTFQLLPDGSPSVFEVTIVNDTMYAATDVGLFMGSVSQDLTVFENWSQDLSIPEPFQSINNVSSVEGILYINLRQGDFPGTYLRTNEEWELINSGGDVLNLTESPNGLVVNTAYYFDVKNLNGTSNGLVGDYENGEPMRLSQAILDADGSTWIADRRLGLVKYGASGFEFINVSGPGTNSAFKLEYEDGRLWVASGYTDHPGNWNNRFLKEGFYRFYKNEWQNYLPEDLPIFDEQTLTDITVAYPDPDNPDFAYCGSWLGGMITAENGEILNVYDENNSSLEVREEFNRPEGQGFVGVSDIVKDDDGNVWMTNGYADKPLAVLRPDGSWDSFSLNNNYDNSDVLTRIIENQSGDLWMVHNRGGVVAYSTSIPEGDANPKLYKSGEGNGGLPSNNVFSITEDLDGEIWVGTDDGVAVFYSPFDAFSNNPSEARQILVEQDGIFQFLLEAQSVSCIAIDGANRKWIGTFGSGVFLLSEDGTEEIQRFTADQSPLFSDVINDIVIDDQTGEVFIATVEGILSYQGDATGGELSNECLTVYPNPVRETYAGPITIEGLMRDSEIKITDTRGNLVASFQSNGGRGIWNGKNLNGERVATGVYFALVSNEAADSDCVSKILIIK